MLHLSTVPNNSFNTLRSDAATRRRLIQELAVMNQPQIDALREDPEILIRLGRIVMEFGYLEFKLDHILIVLVDPHFTGKGREEAMPYAMFSRKLARIEKLVTEKCAPADIVVWNDLIADLRLLSTQRNNAFHGQIVKEDGRLVLLYWDKDQDKKLTSEERSITVEYLDNLLHRIYLRRRQLHDFTNDYSFQEHGHVPTLPLSQDAYPRLRMYHKVG